MKVVETSYITLKVIKTVMTACSSQENTIVLVVIKIDIDLANDEWLFAERES